ncbi:MAG: DEAD/DEAH box helicase [Nitrospira sp.]|nr:DEAD/DEAH box helicase [bacterium]MBL7049244.1 DEAD/DEAH box helicase [Nitrospira sp.]
MKFKDLDIHEKVLEGIKAAGFTECSPVQAQTLPVALQGTDIAAQSQTGTGKTAAFLIAMFSRMLKMPPSGKGSPRALIIAPTRELAVQIMAEADLIGGSTGFKMLAVYGGIDYQKQRDEISKGVDVLIGTPGRLIDYLKQKVYSLKHTQFLVIDEADRLFDMGFISDLRFLLKRLSPYDKRQSMLYSATLSHRVLELCYEHMNLPKKFEVTPETITVDLIDQGLYHVGKSEKLGLLLGILRHEPEGRYLIFCNTRVVVDMIDRFLNANGHPTSSITGELQQQKRMKVLAQFKEGAVPILVATSVASRGLHIDGVTHVINYDIPEDPEDYVHRIGRTARAGACGKAICLACETYVHALADVEEYIKKSIRVIPVTDEMVVTGYKKVSRHSPKKSLPTGANRSGAPKKSSHGHAAGGPGSQNRGRPRPGKK